MVGDRGLDPKGLRGGTEGPARDVRGVREDGTL